MNNLISRMERLEAKPELLSQIADLLSRARFSRQQSLRAEAPGLYVVGEPWSYIDQPEQFRIDISVFNEYGQAWDLTELDASVSPDEGTGEPVTCRHTDWGDLAFEDLPVAEGVFSVESWVAGQSRPLLAGGMRLPVEAAPEPRRLAAAGTDVPHAPSRRSQQIDLPGIPVTLLVEELEAERTALIFQTTDLNFTGKSLQFHLGDQALAAGLRPIRTGGPLIGRCDVTLPFEIVVSLIGEMRIEPV